MPERLLDRLQIVVPLVAFGVGAGDVILAALHRLAEGAQLVLGHGPVAGGPEPVAPILEPPVRLLETPQPLAQLAVPFDPLPGCVHVRRATSSTRYSSIV